MPSSRCLDHLRRGLALHREARLDDAAKAYAAALFEDGRNFDAQHLLGIVLLQQGRPVDARARLEAAVRLRSDHPDARSNLGLALVEGGRPAEALAHFDRALKLRPDYPEAHNNRGNALLDLGRAAEALAAYDAALSQRPSYAEALTNRGHALAALGQHAGALASFDAALRQQPGHAAAHDGRGTALRHLGRRPEALAAYDDALAVRPGHAKTLSNRGIVLRELGRPDEALASLDTALSAGGNTPETFSNRGNVLRDLERYAEALANYDAALAMQPDHADARRNRAMTALLLGDFAAGWADYEWRFTAEERARAPVPSSVPRWTGADPAGLSILVHDEQGLGDIIQMARFVGSLARRAAAVTFILRPALHRLIAPALPGVRVVDRYAPDCACDVQIPLMSLPGLFGTMLDTIPATPAYLTPEADRVEAWRGRIDGEGFRVGLCWQGNPDPAIDLGRSFPLAAAMPLSQVAGTSFVALQKGPGLDQLARLPAGFAVASPGPDLDAGPDAFIDTAAVMAGLDLVITSDTSIAHLAGALGRPVWVALKRVPDWRWLLDRPDSPWYPSMRLYRQESRGDWSGLFARMAEDLARTVAARDAV